VKGITSHQHSGEEGALREEGTSSKHHLNDVNQEKVQGRNNPNSPVDGAEAVGVVPAAKQSQPECWQTLLVYTHQGRCSRR
jgi:hypothetical protein